MMISYIKKFNVAFLSLVFLVSSGLVAPSAEAQVRMRLGHIFASDSPIDTASQKFAKLVAERTNGEITINTFPNSQIGGDESLARDLSRGSVELAFLNPGSLSGLDPLMDIHYLPYIARNFEEADKIFYNPNGILQSTLKEVMTKQRMHVLAFYEVEFRALTNSKHAVTELDDLKGLRLRVPGSAVIREFFIEAGAQAVTMPFGELFTALQQGTIDGQDNGLSLTHNSRLYEAQKYMTNTNHVYAMGAVAVSQRVWNKLTDEQKQIFTDTAQEVSTEQIAHNRQVNMEHMKAIEDSGVAVQDLSPEVVDELQQIAQKIWTKMEPVYGAERIEKLRAEVQAATEN